MKLKTFAHTNMHFFVQIYTVFSAL